MPPTYRYSMLFGLCLAVALGGVNPLRALGAGADPAMLKRIASRVENRTGVIAIEASTPVPYVASQPDPNTFVVELRDVIAVGFQNDFAADPRHPVSAVQVENGRSSDGAVVARVRMTLGRPMRPRVRSSRNVIFVEADMVAGPATQPPSYRATQPPSYPATQPPSHSATETISLIGPSPAIRDVRVQRRGNATAVSLLGTSRLVATSIVEPKTGPRRVVVNLPNVTSAVPGTTTVGQGPVERVRIGIDPNAPLMTQVSVDLSRSAPYRVESSPNGNDLTLVFDEPIADPFSALGTRDSGLGTRDSGLGTRDWGLGTRGSGLGTPRPRWPLLRVSRRSSASLPHRRRPSYPATQQPSDQATQQPSDPATQRPKWPRVRRPPPRRRRPLSRPCQRHRATRGTRSHSTSRAPICAPC